MEPFTVPAQLENLSALRDYVAKAVAEAGLGDKVCYNLSLAVDEIATNIINHGYMENGLDGALTIAGEIVPECLRITLFDDSPAFDPRNMKAPGVEAMDKALEDRPMGGLGIYMAMQSVDKFDYEREGNINKNIFEVMRS